MMIKERIAAALATARYEWAKGDPDQSEAVATLSLALSELTAAEYREDLDEEGALALLRKMVKNGRETASQFSRRAAEESKAQDGLLEVANLMDDPDHIEDALGDARTHGAAAAAYTAKAAAERASSDLLEGYLPRVLDAEATAGKVAEAIAATGAAGKSGIGKVMGWLSANTESGTLDKGLASRLAREALN